MDTHTRSKEGGGVVEHARHVHVFSKASCDGHIHHVNN